MNDWVARYVQGVINRLPEKERFEVEQELTSNIYDMLSDNPSEDEIKEVLLEMGPPAVLAEEYRQEPKYLISPRVYHDYIQVLKYLVPTVGVIVAIIGGIIGGVEGSQKSASAISFVQGVLQNGIGTGLSLGISAAFQALLWTTIGFVIAERYHAFDANNNKKEWRLEDLPQLHHGKKIAISDAIVEMALTLFFSGMLLLEAFDLLPIVFITEKNGVASIPLFSPTFIWKLVPVLIIGILMSVLVNAIKLKDRRWTKRVLQWTLFESLISASLWIILLLQPDLFSYEFTDFLKDQTWAKMDVLHYIASGETHFILVIVCSIIGIVAIAECGNALYQYFRKEAQMTKI